MSPTADQELAELRRANAELQRAGAELRNERDAALAELQARTTALAQRDREYGERIEQQSATIDVLKVMSASPGDAQPVFKLIVERARAFCHADQANLALLDGNMLHLKATTDSSAIYPALFPRPVDAALTFGRAIIARDVVQTPDLHADPDHFRRSITSEVPIRAIVAVPLLRSGTPVGAIFLGRNVPGEFSATQVELLRTFAEQTVIAVTSAETYRELQQALQHQTATSDLLRAISRSTFDLRPVLGALVNTAARLCEADQAAIGRPDGDLWQFAAQFGFPPEFEAAQRARGPYALDPTTVAARAVHEQRVIHIHDASAVPGYPEIFTRIGGQRTSLGVPLLRGDASIGYIVLARQRVEPFTDRQVQLVRTFADQAVIAIENTQLLVEQREALEQQTATAEVLQVINASPGDLRPVFDAILHKAMTLCGASFGGLSTFDGNEFFPAAMRGVPEALADFFRKPYSVSPRSYFGQIVNGATVLHVEDLAAEGSADPAPLIRAGVMRGRALVEFGKARTGLYFALRSEATLLGIFWFYRQEVRPFTNKQIALLENFAAQAVIAMENARLLEELRLRQEELRITFENMGDGVAMFDGTQHLAAWNSKFQEIFDLPDVLLKQHRTYEEHLRFLAARGDFGTGVDTADQIDELAATTGQPYGYERTRPDGRVIEIRRNPVPNGGFVLIFSDITERKRSEAEIRAARDAAEAAYRDLKTAQASLIQAEKMASLGQLTAGIAHEIKNPLNFVNNFASLSVDLLDELKQIAGPGFATLDEARRAEIDDLTRTLSGNLERISEHGNRADAIVRSMLEHSRGSSGERRVVDLNTLVNEALNLAYHGARAQDQSFSITLQRDFGAGITPITLAPQDVTRVLLNMFGNGFYAARRRQSMESTPGFEPTLSVATRELGGAVEIRVRDNGVGIPEEIRDKLFQPFFTTKPTGEGTGLGLSISYDIVTQQHAGSITVDSNVGEYSEFAIRLPRQP